MTVLAYLYSEHILAAAIFNAAVAIAAKKNLNFKRISSAVSWKYEPLNKLNGERFNRS